tara:strand:+ start:18276 stop:18503 length:228 start_codon:yes stop_codon:yes gene_type:complete
MLSVLSQQFIMTASGRLCMVIIWPTASAVCAPCVEATSAPFVNSKKTIEMMKLRISTQLPENVKENHKNVTITQP